MSNKPPVWEAPPSVQTFLAGAKLMEDCPETAKLILNNDELGLMTLTGKDAGKVLESVDAVNDFFEAIDGAGDCMVEISNLELDPDVQTRLEELFEYVEVL